MSLQRTVGVSRKISFMAVGRTLCMACSKSCRVTVRLGGSEGGSVADELAFAVSGPDVVMAAGDSALVLDFGSSGAAFVSVVVFVSL